MTIRPRRKTDYIVIHSAATPASRDIGRKEIAQWHRAKGWRDIGYHYVIRRDGTVEVGRPQQEPGAHHVPVNASSVAVVMVGGTKPDGKTPELNYTPAQFAALRPLIERLSREYPGAEVVGHRDLSPDKNGDGKITKNEWTKACPVFDARHWWATGEVRA